MSTKSAILTLADDDLRFDAVVSSGHTLVIDDGRNNGGPRPTELLLVSLAGCTAMDVISILRKKRQAVTRYEVRVTGEQVAGPPHNFTRFDIEHVVDGVAIDPAAVARAIELSCAKYCAVGTTLASGEAAVHNRYRIRLPEGEDLVGEVEAAGPGANLAELAARV